MHVYALRSGGTFPPHAPLGHSLWDREYTVTVHGTESTQSWGGTGGLLRAVWAKPGSDAG